eukprot:TRINITY_DN32758_c0_g1_i2.p1 TRINITY_DN32758_c0_g1~~TRINITY_DN32758_c0_g1_i2.p1  ORF type:complete len:1804 (+),score=480.55 TRINITY_DN32758_c0_g1_i2:117-5528(+)
MTVAEKVDALERVAARARKKKSVAFESLEAPPVHASRDVDLSPSASALDSEEEGFASGRRDDDLQAHDVGSDGIEDEEESVHCEGSVFLGDVIPKNNDVFEERDQKIEDEKNGSVAALGKQAVVAFEAERFELALELFGRVLKLQQKTLWHGHPDCARTISNMGHALRAQGNHYAAIDFYEIALNLRMRAYGKNIKCAVTYCDIAGAYEAMSKLDAALKHYESALDIFLDTHGRQHPDVAVVYNNMALIYQARSDHRRALETFGHAISIRCRMLGEDHPDVADGFSNMGVVYSQMDRLDYAQKFHVLALQLRRKAFGLLHDDVASSYINLAVVYERRHRQDKAQQLYMRAIDIRRILHGDIHESVADVLYNLGGLQVARRCKDKARSYFEGALRIYAERLGHRAAASRRCQAALDELRDTNTDYMPNDNDDESSGGEDSEEETDDDLNDYERSVPQGTLARRCAATPNAANKRSSMGWLKSNKPSWSKLRLPKLKQGEFYTTVATEFRQEEMLELAVHFYKLSTRHSGPSDWFSDLMAHNYHGIASCYYAWALQAPMAVDGEYNSVGDQKYRLALKYFLRSATITFEIQQNADEQSAMSYVNAARCSVGIAKYKGAAPQDEAHQTAEMSYTRAIDLYTRALDARLVLAEEPACQEVADIYFEMGQCHEGMKEYQDALECYQLAYEIRQSLDARNEKFVVCCRSLARMHAHLLDFDRALAFAQDSYRILHAAHGRLHRDTADALVCLGQTYIGKGLYCEKRASDTDSKAFYESAIALFRRSLDIYTELVGQGAIEYTSSLLHIGHTHELMGDLQSAMQCYNEALDLRRNLCGETHTEVGNAFFALGGLYYRMKDLPASMEKYERALAIRQQVIRSSKKKKEDLGYCHAAIAEVQLLMGQYKLAIKSALTSVSLLNDAIGATHPDLARIYAVIAKAFEEQALTPLAIDFYAKVLSILCGEYTEEDHVDIAAAYAGVARMQETLGQLEKSAQLYLMAIDVASRCSGEDHSSVGQLSTHLGTVYMCMKQPELALKHYQKAHHIAVACDGEDEIGTLHALRHVAAAEHEAGNLEKALELYTEVLNAGSRIWGPEHLEVVFIRAQMAEILTAQKQHAEALECYSRALLDMSVELGRGHLDVGRLYVAQSKCTLMQDKADYQVVSMENALHTWEGLLGNIHPVVADIISNLGYAHTLGYNYECALERYQSSLSIHISLAENGRLDDHTMLGQSYMRVASSLKAMKRYSVAAVNFKRAVDCCFEHNGPESLELADAYLFMGDNFMESGKCIDQALACYRKALTIKESALEESAREIAVIHRRLGDCCSAQDKIALSLHHYKKAALHDHESSLGAIAEIYQSNLLHDQALTYYQDVLDKRRKLLGEHHPDIAQLCCHLADAYSARGDYERALELHEKAKAIYGNSSEYELLMAKVDHRIGSVHLSRCDPEAALKSLDTALKVRVGVHGESDGEVATIYSRMAEARRMMGQYDATMQTYMKAIQVKSQVLGENHHELGFIYGDLAATSLDMGDFEKALSYYSKGTEMIRSGLGHGNHELVKFMRRVANGYHQKAWFEWRQGDLQQAIEVCCLGLDMLRKEIMRSSNTEVGVPCLQRSLGVFHSCMGDLSSAMKCFTAAIDAARQFDDGGIDPEELLESYADKAAHHMFWQEYEMCNYTHNKIVQLRRMIKGWRQAENLWSIRQITTTSVFILPELSQLEQAVVYFELACLWRSCEAMEKSFEFYGKVLTKLQGIQTDETEDAKVVALHGAAKSNMAAVYMLQQETVSKRVFDQATQHFTDALEYLKQGETLWL